MLSVTALSEAGETGLKPQIRKQKLYTALAGDWGSEKPEREAD